MRSAFTVLAERESSVSSEQTAEQQLCRAALRCAGLLHSPSHLPTYPMDEDLLLYALLCVTVGKWDSDGVSYLEIVTKWEECASGSVGGSRFPHTPATRSAAARARSEEARGGNCNGVT